MRTPHRPVKSLGQNFLVDPRVQERIVASCALNENDDVLEIGPGKGAITALIIPRVKRLTAIDKDHALAALLKECYAHEPKIDIIDGDFLKLDMGGMPDDLIIVGNIPYYISTPIIERVLEYRHKIRRAFLMVQLEFAQRLAAKAGEREYGSLSCFIQYYADVKLLFKISPGSFYPAPKVHSAFIRLDIKRTLDPVAIDEKRLFMLIQRSFMQRRKTIANALKGLVEQADLIEILKRSGIEPSARPETITLSNYIKLSNELVL